MSLILSGTDGLSDVDGSAATPAIRGTDANTGIFFPAADTIAFAEGGVESMRIDSSGNVGIGTTSPSGRLHVANTGTAGTTADNLAVYFTSANRNTNVFIRAKNTDGSILNFGDGDSDTAGRLSYEHSDNSLRIDVNSAERMRLDSSGNLLVGTTSTTPTNGGVVSLFGGGESYLNIGHKTGAASGAYYLAGYYNGTLVGGLTQVGTTGIVLTSISDYRLKEDVLPMQDSLSKVMALSPVSYKWKSDGSDGEGFIAHELQAVIPTATTGEKDEVDQEGNAKYQGINLSALVPHLVKAIQEQQALIIQLTARITALESA